MKRLRLLDDRVKQKAEVRETVKVSLTNLKGKTRKPSQFEEWMATMKRLKQAWNFHVEVLVEAFQLKQPVFLKWWFRVNNCAEEIV